MVIPTTATITVINKRKKADAVMSPYLGKGHVSMSIAQSTQFINATRWLTLLGGAVRRVQDFTERRRVNRTGRLIA
jgi:hypothetical protein